MSKPVLSVQTRPYCRLSTVFDFLWSVASFSPTFTPSSLPIPPCDDIIVWILCFKHLICIYCAFFSFIFVTFQICFTFRWKPGQWSFYLYTKQIKKRFNFLFGWCTRSMHRCTDNVEMTVSIVFQIKVDNHCVSSAPLWSLEPNCLKCSMSRWWHHYFYVVICLKYSLRIY